MVSVNVAQLLQEPLGAVREFEFSDMVPAVLREVRLGGPVTGHARLTRTNEGILVHTDYGALMVCECARCLDDVQVEISGSMDEEFLPSVDLRTGVPVEVPDDVEQSLIDAHHEIDLDELLRQNILTNLPLRPLCQANCPGLCPGCGERLDGTHAAHDDEEIEVPVDPANPFAQLAALLNNGEAQER